MFESLEKISNVQIRRIISRHFLFYSKKHSLEQLSVFARRSEKAAKRLEYIIRTKSAKQDVEKMIKKAMERDDSYKDKPVEVPGLGIFDSSGFGRELRDTKKFDLLLNKYTIKSVVKNDQRMYVIWEFFINIYRSLPRREARLLAEEMTNFAEKNPDLDKIHEHLKSMYPNVENLWK